MGATTGQPPQSGCKTPDASPDPGTRRFHEGVLHVGEVARNGSLVWCCLCEYASAEFDALLAAKGILPLPRLKPEKVYRDVLAPKVSAICDGGPEYQFREEGDAVMLRQPELGRRRRHRLDQRAHAEKFRSGAASFVHRATPRVHPGQTPSSLSSTLPWART